MAAPPGPDESVSSTQSGLEVLLGPRPLCAAGRAGSLARVTATTDGAPLAAAAPADCSPYACVRSSRLRR